MSPLPENHRPDSIEWITSNAMRMLEDQQRRAESLQTRAAQIAGFAGATVALAAPLGRKVTDGSQHFETLGSALYFTGNAALALTIVFSIIFVLRTVNFYALGEKEIGHYIEDERFLVQTRAEIQFRTLKSIKPAVGRYEAVNEKKAKWLNACAFLFLVGLVLTVAVASIIVIDQLCFPVTMTHTTHNLIPILRRNSL